MKLSADYRRIARGSLKGKWIIAGVTAYIASLLGGMVANGRGGLLSNVTNISNSKDMTKNISATGGDNFSALIAIITISIWCYRPLREFSSPYGNSIRSFRDLIVA